MSGLFKKRAGGSASAANVPMTEAEAALAQSDFNMDKISEIQNKFTGGVVLLVPGRIFIREGLLWKMCRKGPKKRQFFLFNDVLVYGSIVASRYSNQQVLPLAQMSVSAECQYKAPVKVSLGEKSDEQLDVGNAFQISHANKSFHVFAMSAADKSNWLSNLSKHISKVASLASAVHTRAVWVPDSLSNDCMLCHQHFTTFVRKHHCRQCGRVVCSSCSPHRVQLGGGKFSEGKLERACRECFKTMLNPVRDNDGSPDGERRNSDRMSPPSPAVAARLVSSVLRSKSQGARAKPLLVQRGKDSSTDTEDSDDSEEEGENEEEKKESEGKNEKRVEGQESNPVVSESRLLSGDAEEPQPTPPPRKKKLRKQQTADQTGSGQFGTPPTQTSREGSTPLTQTSREGRIPPTQTDGEGSTPPTQTDGKGSTPLTQTSGEGSTPPTQTDGEESTPPTQTDGEESTPPTQTDGEESTPPTQTDGEESTPPTQTDGEESTPPTQTDGKVSIPPTQTDGEGSIPPTQTDREGCIPPTQTDGEGSIPPTQTDGEGCIPPTQIDGEESTPLTQTDWEGSIPPTQTSEGGNTPKKGRRRKKHFIAEQLEQPVTAGALAAEEGTEEEKPLKVRGRRQKFKTPETA